MWTDQGAYQRQHATPKLPIHIRTWPCFYAPQGIERRFAPAGLALTFASPSKLISAAPGGCSADLVYQCLCAVWRFDNSLPEELPRLFPIAPRGTARLGSRLGACGFEKPKSPVAKALGFVRWLFPVKPAPARNVPSFAVSEQDLHGTLGRWPIPPCRLNPSHNVRCAG